MRITSHLSISHIFMYNAPPFPTANPYFVRMLFYLIPSSAAGEIRMAPQIMRVITHRIGTRMTPSAKCINRRLGAHLITIKTNTPRRAIGMMLSRRPDHQGIPSSARHTNVPRIGIPRTRQPYANSIMVVSANHWYSLREAISFSRSLRMVAKAKTALVEPLNTHMRASPARSILAFLSHGPLTNSSARCSVNGAE